MKSTKFLALTLCAAAVTASGTAQAQWFQWSGNGHYYGVFLITGGDHSWSAARAQAQAQMAPNSLTGDLATITSADENAFVFSLVDQAQYWVLDGAGNNEGPYLGGFQPAGSGEPGGGWSWVTGEAWTYSNWAGGEPNNFGGSENFLSYFAHGNNRGSTWNDVGDAANSVHNAYVVEVVPEPASMIALGAGLAAIAARRRRKQ